MQESVISVTVVGLNCCAVPAAVQVCEGATGTISCTAPGLIRISRVNYGRLADDPCSATAPLEKRTAIHLSGCRSPPDSFDVIRNK